MPKNAYFRTLIVLTALAAATADAAPPAPHPHSFDREKGVFSVREFGARGDGTTKNTEAIQSAIDAAASSGGGTVLLPPGRYVSGTLFLRNHVTLKVERGAVLLGSTDLADYPKKIPALRSYTDNYVQRSLIYAENVEDVGIEGRGVIDGRGAAFKGKTYYPRPYLIRFIRCRRVTVEDITLRNSPMWMQHYLACDFVKVRGIRVFNQVNYNNDMIDIDGCRNVIISDCFADSGDDAITLKSTLDRACENVAITNCVLFSTCNAIKMGTESNGGFRNITISNCTIGPLRNEAGFFGSRKGLAGIALMIVDGGTMDGVAISNITMKSIRVPIFIRLGNRARPFKKDMPKPAVGSVRNITITDVIAEPSERYACSVTGIPGHPVRNVTLRNIRILAPGGGTREEAEAAVPENATSYPESTKFGHFPAYGFYCRHVENLTLSGIDLSWKTKDLRPALRFEDVRDLRVEGLTARCAPEAPAAVILSGVRNAFFTGCVPSGGVPSFLRLLEGTERVSAVGNDLSETRNPFSFENGVDRAILFKAANRE